MISFVKMQAQGNDFVVIDATAKPVAMSPARARLLAGRRFGIGCDQILLIAPARRRDCDFMMRVFNPDGGEVGQCGNGARCVALFLRRAKRLGDKIVRLQTKGGAVRARAISDSEAEAELGVPRFAPGLIPLARRRQAARYKSGGESFAALSLGNPHAVIYLPDKIDDLRIAKTGAALNRGNDFPQGVNVGFYRKAAAGAIFLRIFERGVNAETPACGSGAAAAAVTAMREQSMRSPVTVKMPGGDLRVEWSGADDSPVLVRGAGCFVFRGETG